MELKQTKRPTFVGLKFDGPTLNELSKITKGVPNRVSKGELHVTLIYSKAPISFTARGKLETPISIKPKHYSIFETDEGPCLVLELNSPALIKRHNEIMALGASYPHDVYNPHVTLSYNVGEKFDIASLPPVESLPNLVCHQEYSQRLDTNWKNKAA